MYNDVPFPVEQIVERVVERARGARSLPPPDWQGGAMQFVLGGGCSSSGDGNFFFRSGEGHFFCGGGGELFVEVMLVGGRLILQGGGEWRAAKFVLTKLVRKMAQFLKYIFKDFDPI